MTTVETNTSGGLVPEWTIGDRLRKARTWANISAETMARAIGRSVRTVSNYETDATPVPLLVLEKYEKLTGAALESFIGSKRAPRTKHAYRSDLKVFYAWALSHKLMKVDPAVELGSIRVPKSLPRPIDPAQALAMLWHGSLRVRRMIALALYAGLRTFEIAQLDAADVWTHAEPPVVVVRNGKGSKDRSVPMHPMLRELLADLPSAGHLFPSNRCGRSMHPESVARAMTRHMQASGVDGTPHQLRHSFGTELANRSGGDMVLTASLMGHESMTTTLGYVRLAGGRSADVVTAMFPVVA